MISVIYTFSMTIQNIEDVMDRIMSLNRNLNEDSLRTLLSASGWDKGDIIEGLKIFRLRNQASHSFFEPSVSAPTYSPITKVDENYSFNIQKEKDEKKEIVPEGEIPIIPLPLAPIKEDTIKIITSSKVEEPKKEEPAPPIPKEIINEETPKKNFSAKFFTFILILLLTFLVIGYFRPGFFGNFINKFFYKNQNKSQIVNPVNTLNLDSNNIPISSSTQDYINSSSSLSSLLQEISNLRNELNDYKAANQSTKTIVKYISQRGPTGKAGRGISYISATSTGFVINYTDNTSIIIPYSTTTIINILNSNAVCFRDISSSTQIGSDICLDRNTISKLVASSTVSH